MIVILYIGVINSTTENIHFHFFLTIEAAKMCAATIPDFQLGPHQLDPCRGLSGPLLGKPKMHSA